MNTRYLLCLILFFASCTSESQRQKLLFAETEMEHQPDSVLRMLEQMDSPSGIFSRKDRAHYALLRVQALDKNALPITDDSLLNIALNYYSGGTPTIELAKTYYYQGCYYVDAGMTKEAIKSFTEAKNMAEKFTDYNLLGLISSRLGRLYVSQFYTDKALDSYGKSIEYFRKSGNLKNECRALADKGRTFLHIAKYDSTLYYFNCAKNKDNIQNDTVLFSTILNLEGYTYLCINNLSQAKQLILESIKWMGNRIPPDYYTTLSDIYLAENNLDSAEYATRAAHWEGRETVTYMQLSEIEERRGNYKLALMYTQQMSELADSLYRGFRKNSIPEIQQRYNYEREKNRVIRLELERLLLQRTVILTIIAFITLWLIYQRKIRQQKERENQYYQQLIDLRQEKVAIEKVLTTEMGEKDVALTQFFQRRVESLQNAIALSNKFLTNPDKFHEAYLKLISAESYQPEDWASLRKGANYLHSNIIDYLESTYPALSGGELQYFSLVCCGLSTQEIAVILKISEASVFKKRTRIRSKLELEKNASLELFCQNLGKKLRIQQ